jgi:hypothetical protein
MRRVALIGVVALLVVGCAWWLTKGKHTGPVLEAGSAPRPAHSASPDVAEPLDAVVTKSDRTAAPTPPHPAQDEVSAGAPAVTRTTDAADVDVPFASFSGELVIPVAWNAEHPRLAARRKDSPKSFTQARHVEIGPPVRSGQFDTFQWKIFNLTPGAYEILSLDQPCATEAVLDPAGTANVRLEVPAPARVFVRVVDSRTNEPVPARFLMCTPKRADGSLYPMADHAERNKETETYVLRCPPGDAQLTCPYCGLDYGEGRSSVNVLPGDNYFTVRLMKFAGVRLTLLEGESPFQPAQDHFDIREVDGEGHVMVWDGVSESGALIAKVTNPGRYRVKLKAGLAGYLMPVEQIIDLEDGRMTDVVFRLTKKP